MLISHKKHFIYTKTLKTASTSVERYFEPYCINEGEIDFSHRRHEYISESGIIGARTGSTLDLQASTWWNHMPAKTIKALIGDDIWNTYFKFFIIRNPFEKMVSAYHYYSASRIAETTRLDELHSPNADLSLKVDFESWLNTIPMPIDRNKYFIDSEYCMDYVIKFESLADGLQEVCDKLDINYHSQILYHMKKSRVNKKQLEDYYTDKSIKLVKDSYKYELENFGYSVPWA